MVVPLDTPHQYICDNKALKHSILCPQACNLAAPSGESQ